MNPRRAVLVYTLIRLGMFAVIFVGVFALFRLQMNTFPAAMASAAIAAIASLCLSYIFLRRPRNEIAKALHDKRQTRASASVDDEAEDAEADATR